MSIPPEPIIRGAQRWLQLIPVAGIQRARALLATAREFADLTPTQYAESLEWIHEANLLGSGSEASEVAADPLRLLEAVIIGGTPSWLRDADVLIQNVAEIPDDAFVAANALGVSPSNTLACIRRAWGRVDTELRQRIGDQGEREVLSRLDTVPGVTIDHVASWSDAHGYDIAVASAQGRCHLEVKATTRANRLTFHLSRNEYETMKTDPDWQLVIVVLDHALRLSLIFSVMKKWLDSCAPIDTAIAARWDSARFEAPPAICEPGVPMLAPFLSDQTSPLLIGRPSS
jgi:hypothetical protein